MGIRVQGSDVPPVPCCPECQEDKTSPWYDESSGLWVHVDKFGLIVPCGVAHPEDECSTEET